MSSLEYKASVTFWSFGSFPNLETPGGYLFERSMLQTMIHPGIKFPTDFLWEFHITLTTRISLQTLKAEHEDIFARLRRERRIILWDT